MKIAGVRIQNYRSIEDLRLTFPSFYTAICGKNDAGKSNILRLLRIVFRGPERNFWPVEQNVVLKDDFTKWKEHDKASDPKFIQVDVTLEIKQDDDEGLHRFLQDYLQLPVPSDGVSRDLQVDIMIRYRGEPSVPEVAVQVSNQLLEVLKSQEVLKKVQSSFAVLFHDSTEFFHPYRFLESTGMFQEMSDAEAARISQARAGLDKALTKIAKRNQEDLTQVLEAVS